MAITTVSSLNSLFSVIYDEAVFAAREMNLMTNLVTVKSARGWMNRSLNRWATGSAEAVADGVDYTNATTFSKSADDTISPSEVIEQFILTDQMIDTDPDGAREAAAFELGNAVATKIDTDIGAEMANFTTGKGDGAGSSATIGNFAVSVSYLRNQKAPNPLYAVVHPYHWHDIWIELGQPGANQALLGDVANEAMRDFFVGTWLNIRWFINANIAVDASDDAISGVFHPQAIVFDSRRPPRLEPERDASLRAWELNMTAGYGVGRQRDEWGVNFKADATEPT